MPEPAEHDNQIHVCPDNVRHVFKEVRVKSKQVGERWHFFKQCARCTCIMETIVGHKVEANGDVVPTAASFLITSSGSVKLTTTVRRATRSEAEQA